MSLLLPIVSFVSILLILILIVIIFYLKYKEEELPRNITKVWNFMPQYAEGRADGVVDNFEVGPKRSIIKYYPGDINPTQKISLKPVKAVVENNKKMHLARGVLSKDTDVLVILPPTSDDFPDEFKNSFFGRMFMDITEDINARKVNEDILRERLNNVNQTRIKTDSGKIFTDALENIETISKDQLRVISKDKDSRDKSSGEQSSPYFSGPPKL